MPGLIFASALEGCTAFGLFFPKGGFDLFAGAVFGLGGELRRESTVRFEVGGGVVAPPSIGSLSLAASNCLNFLICGGSYLVPARRVFSFSALASSFR